MSCPGQLLAQEKKIAVEQNFSAPRVPRLSPRAIRTCSPRVPLLLPARSSPAPRASHEAACRLAMVTPTNSRLPAISRHGENIEQE
jgi:hypothetical protein